MTIQELQNFVSEVEKLISEVEKLICSIKTELKGLEGSILSGILETDLANSPDKQKIIEILIKLKKEKKDIIGFDPEQFGVEIKKAKKDINDMIYDNGDNPIFEGIMPTMIKMRDYIERAHKIIANYENIYLHILKPINEKAREGINITKRWAIISIIFAAILSIISSHFIILDIIPKRRENSHRGQPLERSEPAEGVTAGRR